IERQDSGRAAQLIAEQLEDDDLSKTISKQPLSYVAANLVSGLEGAQLVIWWNEREQRLELGTYCERQRTASYASLLVPGVQPFPVARCKECGKRFLQDSRQPREYCTKQHRNTYNVRQSRQRARKTKTKRR